MKIGIHQPNFFPWIGYFAKIMMSDRFVVLDDAEYSKNNFINRSQLLDSNGVYWFTLPVNYRGSSKTRINEMKVETGKTWQKKTLKRISLNYKSSPFFDQVLPAIESIIRLPSESLVELNLASIESICNLLDIEFSPLFSSSLGIKTKGSDRILDITSSLGGSVYLTGSGGLNYLDQKKFSYKNIQLVVVNQEIEPYTHLLHSNQFEPGLSIIDSLFSVGPSNTLARLQRIISN